MKRYESSKLLMTIAVTVAVWIIAANSSAAEPKQVPFELDRNRVIIPTTVNGSRAFGLILDTGMGFDGILLFHKEFANEIDMTGAIEVKIPGAGGGEPSTAQMIESGKIGFGDVVCDSQRVIINHAEYTQHFPTDGVIGWNLFGHYTVEIDYDDKIITLHDTADFQPESDWTQIPVIMKKNLPFLAATLEVIEGEVAPATLYIDLASGDALELLVRPDQKFSMPDSLEEKLLGTGLSGDIFGHEGVSRRLRIASFDLHDITTAFAPAEIRSKQQGADGILGNDAIRRFNIIFDYPRSRLFIKPNSFFDTPFEQTRQPRGSN